MCYVKFWFPGWQENKSLTKETAFCRNHRFLFEYFFNENNIAKLVVVNLYAGILLQLIVTLNIQIISYSGSHQSVFCKIQRKTPVPGSHLQNF